MDGDYAFCVFGFEFVLVSSDVHIVSRHVFEHVLLLFRCWMLNGRYNRCAVNKGHFLLLYSLLIRGNCRLTYFIYIMLSFVAVVPSRSYSLFRQFVAPPLGFALIQLARRSIVAAFKYDGINSLPNMCIPCKNCWYASEMVLAYSEKVPFHHFRWLTLERKANPNRGHGCKECPKRESTEHSSPKCLFWQTIGMRTKYRK